MLALFLLLAPGLAGLGRGGILPLVGAALAMALYCSLFCGLCCLLTEGAAGCGTASFALALAFLALIPYLAFWGAAALAPAVRWSPVALYLRAGGGSWGDGLALAAGAAAVLALAWAAETKKKPAV